MRIQVSNEVLAAAIHEYLNKRDADLPQYRPKVYINGDSFRRATVIYESPRASQSDGEGFLSADPISPE